MEYCKWYCVEFISNNRWLFKSTCGESREISRHEKMFKNLYDNNKHICPKCGKLTTVGELLY